MTLTLSCVAAAVEAVAPLSLAEPWDRPGLQVGHPRAPVSSVLIALDPSPRTVDEARRRGADLVLTHHPLFLKPIERLNLAEPPGEVVRSLVSGGIGLYAAHTNLDRAPGGVNDWLARRLGLGGVEPFGRAGPGEPGPGRVGALPGPAALGEWAAQAAERLGCRAPRLVGDPGARVERVAVCGGSGASLWPEAQGAGAQVLVTGDVKHHPALDALAAGMALLDLGHVPTERGAVAVLEQIVRGLAAQRGEPLEIFVLEEGEPWAPVGA